MADLILTRPSRANSAGILALALCAGAVLAAMLVRELSPGTAADVVMGFPLVRDGDSLRVGGREIRLYGIDAPETRQSCTDAAGRDWACGAAATSLMNAMAAKGGAHVACRTTTRDKYRRFVSICMNGAGEDLGAMLVRAGLAVAYRRYSEKYVGEENEARAGRRGIWSGSFQQPEDWRRANPRLK